MTDTNADVKMEIPPAAVTLPPPRALLTLPTELVNEILLFACLSKWQESRNGESGGLGSERFVLKPDDGVPLTCKEFHAKWSKIIWSAHPPEVGVYATENKTKLLHKIPGLRKISIYVCYTNVNNDMKDVQRNVVSAESLLTRFPALKTLSLHPTTHGVQMPMQKFKRLLMTDGNHMTSYAVEDAKKPSDVQIYYCGAPRDQYDLASLGACPPGLTLICSQFPLPRSIHGFANVELQQCMSLDGNNAKAIRSSHIKGFKMRAYGLEGCSMGNTFTIAQLNQLPSSLEVLTLDSSSSFNMPFKFPSSLSNLKLLKLGGCKWIANNAAKCLPAGLKILEIELDFSGAEDSPDYNFDSFDISNLPGALEELKMALPRHRHTSKTFHLTGSFAASPQLKRLTLSSVDFDVGPCLPASLLELKLEDPTDVMPLTLPAALTRLDMQLERPGASANQMQVKAPKPKATLSLDALSQKAPHLQVLVLRLEREYHYGGREVQTLPNLPTIEGNFSLGFAALREVRCTDKSFLASLSILALAAGRKAIRFVLLKAKKSTYGSTLVDEEADEEEDMQ